ncbi:MAG TPA: peptidylprolyl isomerase [Thiobacillaceae bacterium]|nr:peptidylprolyl isomerase [Thiobacillaceae bacterium]
MLPVLALMATLSVPGLAADTVAPAGDRPEPQADTPVARVNGVAIPALYMDFVRQSRIARNLPAEALTPDALRDGLVASELLVQEATRKGLDKEPSVAAALEFQRRELLAKAAVEDFVRKNPVSEADMKAEYDQAKAKTGDREYRVSHILVSTEREARDILAQLKKPKVKFETLAKKYSKDSSADNGGDIGWTVPANLVPEFAQAMTRLKKGETATSPVKTQYGWHVLRLTDTRTLDFPAYESIKGRIANQLQQLAIRRHVQALRAEARVE